MDLSGQNHGLAALTSGKNLGFFCTGGCADRGDGSGWMENRNASFPHRDLKLDLAAHSLVTKRPGLSHFLLFLSIHCKISFSPLRLFFHSDVSTKYLHAFLLTRMCATCLELITLITYGGQCKSWKSLICYFVHPPVTSTSLGPNIFRSI
jgi:hypothetical protein